MVLSKLVIFLNMKKLWKKFEDGCREIDQRFLTGCLHLQHCICEKPSQFLQETWKRLLNLVPEPARVPMLISSIFIVGGTFFLVKMKGRPLDYSIHHCTLVAFAFLAVYLAAPRRPGRLRRFYRVVAFCLGVLAVASGAIYRLGGLPKIPPNPMIKTNVVVPPPPEAGLDSCKAALPRSYENIISVEIKEIEAAPKIDSVSNEQLDQNIMGPHIDSQVGQPPYSLPTHTNLYNPIGSPVRQSPYSLPTYTNLYNPIGSRVSQPPYSLPTYTNVFNPIGSRVSQPPYSLPAYTNVYNPIGSRVSQAPYSLPAYTNVYNPIGSRVSQAPYSVTTHTNQYNPIDSRISQGPYYPGTLTNPLKSLFLSISYPQPSKLFKEMLTQKYTLPPIPEILLYIYHSRTSQEPSSLVSYPIRNFIGKISRDEERPIEKCTPSPNAGIVLNIHPFWTSQATSSHKAGINLQSLGPSRLLNIGDSELGNKKKFVERSTLERIVAVSFEAVVLVFYLRHIR